MVDVSRADDDFGPALFAWGMWLVLFAVAVAFVFRYALVAPCGDDWTEAIPVLVGERSLNADYFWRQNNEHRLPLVRILLVPLVWASGGWFRLENFLNVGLMGLVAAGLLRVAGRLRGRHHYADAVIPLALLNLGHFEVLIGRLTFNHILAMALTSALLALVVTRRRMQTLSTMFLAGAVLLALPLCGANGLPLALAGAAWLASAAFVEWRAGNVRWGLTLFVVASAAVLLVGVYFVGYRPVAGHPPPPGLRAFLVAAGRILSRSAFPWIPNLWPWCALLLLGLLLLTGWLLLSVLRQSPAERWRAVGLLLFLGAMAGVVLGAAWGRAGLGEMAGSAPRYATLTIPAVLGMYYAWLLYAPSRIRDLVPVGLLVLFCGTFSLSAAEGCTTGEHLRAQSVAFLRDVQTGVPSAEVARRYAGVFYTNCEPMIARVAFLLDRLRLAGHYPPGRPAVPATVEATVNLTPCYIHEMTWNGGAGEAVGEDPHVVFALDAARPVHAVAVRFVLRKPVPGPAVVEFFWSRQGHDTFEATGNHVRFSVTPREGEQVLFVPIGAIIDRFRVDPDTAPCHFEIRDISILSAPPG